MYEPIYWVRKRVTMAIKSERLCRVLCVNKINNRTLTMYTFNWLTTDEMCFISPPDFCRAQRLDNGNNINNANNNNNNNNPKLFGRRVAIYAPYAHWHTHTHSEGDRTGEECDETTRAFHLPYIRTASRIIIIIETEQRHVNDSTPLWIGGRKIVRFAQVKAYHARRHKIHTTRHSTAIHIRIQQIRFESKRPFQIEHTIEVR